MSKQPPVIGKCVACAATVQRFVFFIGAATLCPACVESVHSFDDDAPTVKTPASLIASLRAI